MNNLTKTNGYSYLGAIILGISLIATTIVLGNYLLKARQAPRSITMKGLAERRVTATLGVWTISTSGVGNDLQVMQSQIKKQRDAIMTFLTKRGFDKEECTDGIPEIYDREADKYNHKDKAQYRYIGKGNVVISTNKVKLLEETCQNCEELIKQDVRFGDRWNDRPKFVFTALNSIKPSMIQEATIEAQKAAEQFANDTGYPIGKIVEATQGLFTIEDTEIPTQKNVRVIMSVKYELLSKKD